MTENQAEAEGEVKDRLEQMWEQLHGRSKSISENHIEEYNDSIAKEIANGDLELPNRNFEVTIRVKQLKNIRHKQHIEVSVRDEILKRAERQKAELQNKLKYVSHSIDQLREADASPRHLNPHNTSQRYPAKQGEESQQLAKIDLKQRNLKFKKQMEERAKRLKALKREAQLKEQLKENDRKQHQEQLQKEQSQKKKHQIEENIKKIKERVDKRQIEMKQGNDRIRDLVVKEKMYQKLEAGYHHRQLSLLDERKRKLSEIRNLYKPLDHEELVNHEQRFLEHRKQKQELRQRQRKMVSQRSYEIPYESSFYKRIKEKEEEDPLSSDRAKLEKIKVFAEHVKDNFKPEVDPHKKKQMEDLLRKEQEQIKQKEQKEKQLVDKGKKKGLEYLNQLKLLPKPLNMSTPRADSQPKAFSTPRTQYKNYITHTEHKSNPWKRILNSSVDSQDNKALRVYYESMRIQEQLKRKQQITKLKKDGDCKDIDQGYYDMIKAKLQVLDSK